ncbi:MAG: CGNR zinc finger domain-containing protein [Aeromicrobium sp.]
MVFTHDTECALVSAVELANSAEPPESMFSTEELAAFFARHGYTGTLVGDAAELDAVRALRPQLRTLLTSTRDDAVPIVNGILAEAGAVPRLVRHGEYDWHLHATADDQPLQTRIAVETAMAMIDAIRSDELSRLSTCAADDCDDVVLDLSRNRSRKFCSTTCGNREAVAAYRARQSQ